MNVLVDSYGWIEYFGDGRLAEKYAKYIEKANTNEYVTPSIVLYEVYKKIRKERNEEKALEACAYIIRYTMVVPLDEEAALYAAEKSLRHGMGMADSIIMSTAENRKAKIVTSDEHFRGLGSVVYIE